MQSQNGNTENIQLGTCKVLFDGQDMGLTIGGVDVNVTTETHQTTVDQYGDTVVNEYIKGRNVTVSTRFAETTLENLVALMPGSKLVVDATDPSKMRVDVSTGVGKNLVKLAKPLVLHPIDLPDEDKSQDFTLLRAATPGGMEYAFKKDDERVYTAEFKGYPDAEGKLFTVGDPAVVPA